MDYQPEKKKKKTSEKKKPSCAAPINNLLLAYTYFINPKHTSYISVGFDSETFDVKVILFKNTIATTLKYQDWENFYNNFYSIATHFATESNNTGVLTEIPKKDGNCVFKLSCRNKEKCLLITEGTNKISITPLEWENLHAIAHYINSVIIWSTNISPDIKAYYEKYLEKCIAQNVIKLLPFDFYLPHPITIYNNCNFSRLFNEVAVISKNKLVNDFYEYTCNQLENQ